MILWPINGNMKNSLEDESAGVAGVVGDAANLLI